MDPEREAADGPFSALSGPTGVLCLHGYTGSPRSMRPLAEALADAGFSVELPLLPGHVSTTEALDATVFADWYRAADTALSGLVAHSDTTVVIGHSMGGALALSLALAHPAIAGLVLINPLVRPPAPSLVTTLNAALVAGVRTIPSVGGDTKRPGVITGGGDATPIAPLLSIFAELERLSERLDEITCPVLLVSSRVDHVVPVDSGDLCEEAIAGPLERVWLEESFHVAMLDNDADEIEARVIAFAAKLGMA